MQEVDLKITRLKNILEVKGYYGPVHINGIEQGTVEQVIKSCFALKYGGRAEDFKDPVVMTHFSLAESGGGYMVAKFAIELDHPERFRIKEILLEHCNGDHDILAAKKVVLSQNMDTPTIERARQMVSAGKQESKKQRGKSL